MSESDGRDVPPAASRDEDDRIASVLRDQGVYASTTVGISMWPMLRNRRDTIVIRPIGRSERLNVGDVVLYQAQGRHVLHRIVGVHDGWYAIRGDNCLPTERVSGEQILGRLDEFYRGSRHVVVSESRIYRLYWRTWLILWPVRRLWKHVRSAMGRVLRRFGWRGLHPDRGPF